MTTVATLQRLDGAVRVQKQAQVAVRRPDVWRVELGERDAYGTPAAAVYLTRQEAELLVSELREALA